ncbi:MAG: 16S rRNA (guanine(527)-N(7))-methyltransferase RsmG [Gammaproteobacteria bacterium]|nr:16S rRNA (guanine(527)-N(7))-methyltransferase RsmG [Gammaproteobacteria bacterium]
MSIFKKTLTSALTKNGYTYSDETLKKLLTYLELLQKWNKVFNLTAIADPEDMVWLHIIDSLAVGPYLQGKRIIDVGTGAGLPGIPLAITYPEQQFVLLDSNGKKSRFLVQAKLELGLDNIEVVHARCEDYIPEIRFDSIVSRAFSTIAVMLERTQHLLADQGQFLAMKGLYPDSEIQEIPVHFQVMGTHKLAIQGLAAQRHLVCIARK